MARRLAALLVGLAAAGCGGGESEGIVRGGNVIGETLTVYSVLPQPERGVTRDMVDGQRLALQQAGGRAGAFRVTFVSLDETGGAETPEELPGAVASSVRQAIADAQITAVIGDFEPETAEVSVPLLTSAGILHVSPAVDDPRFEAERYYPAGERTFFTGPSLAPFPGAAPPSFTRGFRAAFGRRPGEGAEVGYAAMRSVLAAIERAGTRASSRQAVIDAFRASG